MVRAKRRRARRHRRQATRRAIPAGRARDVQAQAAAQRRLRGRRLQARGGRAGVASLLLGLYDEEGLLDHVGFTSAFAAADRPALLDRLRPYIGGAGFSGKAPGGPSRWRKAGESEWVRLAPELVVEVGYDQVTGRRFRHGTRFLRWRPDKAPRQCTMEQLAPPLGQAELEQLLSGV
ncbi:hypothetical protein ACFSTI_27825 [Rhizorhabdus histidinilytica]